MKDSEKAFLTTGIVLLLFVLISGIFLAVSTKSAHNYDWYSREELSGSLDFLIVGASQGQCALYTEEIDQIIGCNSYNLCYDAEKNYEKRYLLNKELSRNEVETVILEVSYDALQLPDKTDYTDANIFSIMRMDSFGERMHYLAHNVDFNNKLYVFAELMYQGWRGSLQAQNTVSDRQTDLKGSRLIPAKDHSLSPEEVVDAYNEESFTISSLNEETVSRFTSLIGLCQEYDVNVIVVVVPVSDNSLWRVDNLDEFSAWASKYCADNNIEYIDFNLLKDRYILFSDVDCYSTDIYHMSGKGAKIFSKIFARIICEKLNNQDISKYFYNSFNEMKQDSPYMCVYKGDNTVVN